MITRFSIAAIGAAACIAVASATPVLANQHGHGARTLTVTISCYRGPWEDVIWDRPNAIFIDSLVALGYDYSEAQAIGERVCRDEAGVGNPDVASAVMQRIYAENPPR